jgi:hypothetical protein
MFTSKLRARRRGRDVRYVSDIGTHFIALDERKAIW